MFYSRSNFVRQSIILAMILPALLFITISFASGFIISLLQSFDYFPLIGKYHFSLQVYSELLHSRVFYNALLFSMSVSLISTVAAAIIAVLIALWLRPYTQRGGILYGLLQFNLPVPHLVGALTILMILGQSGLLSRLGYMVGLVDQPSQFPILVTDQHGAGIILAYIWKEAPFIAVAVLSILKSWVIPYEKQIQLLGANRWQRFRYVTLPYMLPALLSSSILVFAFTFGSFEVPYILGSISQPTLPILAYQAYLNSDLSYRGEAMAINTVITCISFIMIWLYMKWGEAYASPHY